MTYKKIAFGLFALSMGIIGMNACSPTSEVNFPKLEFKEMSPSDTVQSQQVTAISFRLTDADANTTSLKFSLIYTDLKDTVNLDPWDIPADSRLSYRDIDLIVNFKNGQASSDAGAIEIKRNKYKALYGLGYNILIQAVAIDAYGNTSNQASTPIFFITGR